MKAIRVEAFGEPEVMKWVELPAPDPGPGQVLVRIAAAGVNPVDAYIRAGQHARKPPLPYTPGQDGAGTVVSLGPGVSGLKAGDRVFLTGSISGTYAEQALCAAASVHPLPDRASFPQGASLGVACITAWRALFELAQARAGESVLVHGASGGVGTAAVQLARAAGLFVLGTASSEAGKRLVLEQGAHHCLEHGSPELVDRVRGLTLGAGVSVVIEMLANKNLATDLNLLAPRGRVVIVGSRGSIELDPRAIMTGEKRVLGSMLFNASPDELASAIAALQAALECGTLRPVVGEQLPMAEAQKAHRRLFESAAFGKIVLV